MMQQNLAHARSDAPTRSKAPARSRSARQDNCLFATVAVSTLAAVAVFSLFYAIGAVVGLALIGAAGVALIVGLAWLSLKASRRRSASRPTPRAPMA